MAAATPPAARHYGMDWLRIAAFGLLILYHVGMVFVPWNFHINADPPLEWLTLPMLAVNPWRLTLLFVVSGYASRKLLAKSDGVGGFLKNRSFRLLVPLLFGMIVIVPPQPWVELVVKHGYAAGFDWFWLHDYFRFGKLAGIDLPTWNHLWFVAYLWAYTAALALALPLLRRLPLQLWFDRAFGGAGVLWLPLLWLVAVHAWWFSMAAETHAFVGDWVAHAMYVPAFLFGFGLAGSERAMAAITRAWKPALALALTGYAAIIYVEALWPGNAPVPRWVYRPYGAAHALQQWGAIVALIALAERRWNRDAPGRPMLTEAVFPFYLIHQTIIVVAMYWLRPAALPAAAEFAILVAATVAGCWAFYLGGRRVTPLRPLIGLRAAG
jgi:peptidoglycan/LPS O-acetylase OafA/YrhL